MIEEIVKKDIELQKKTINITSVRLGEAAINEKVYKKDKEKIIEFTQWLIDISKNVDKTTYEMIQGIVLNWELFLRNHFLWTEHIEVPYREF